MSSTASNYDVGKLYLGALLSISSFVLCFGSLLHMARWKLLSAFGTIIITILYGIMMFGSSFVEEEQHFWYWSLSGWIAYICSKRQVTSTCVVEAC